MAGPRWKRIARRLVALGALLVIAGGLAWRWLLPGFLERRGLAALATRGIREPAFHLRSLGLHAAELSDLHAAGPAWEIHLDRARAGYFPAELLRPRIERLDLDGLVVTLAPFAWPPAALPPPSETPLLAALPGQFPLGRLTISNGMLRLRRGALTRELPFHVALTASPDGRSLDVRMASRAPGQLLRLEGVVGREAPSRLTAAFELRQPAEWLAFVFGEERPAAPAKLPVPKGPLAGEVSVKIAAGASEATVSLRLLPWRLALGETHLVLRETFLETRLGRDGPRAARLKGGAEIVGVDGWRVVLPEVTARFEPPGRLEVGLTAGRVSGFGGAAGEGDLRLTVEDARAGAAAKGRVTFALRALAVPGLKLAPFTGEVWGDQTHLGFRIPALAGSNLVAWRLLNLTGEVRRPLLPDAEATVRGRLVAGWPGWVALGAPLPFDLAFQRRGEAASASLTLALSNVVLPRPGGREESAGLHGRLRLAAEYGPRATHVSSHLELAAPKLVVAGWTAEAPTLTGDVRVALAPATRFPLPGLLRRLGGWLPGGLRELPADGAVAVQLQARSLAGPGGLQLEEPRLRLDRQPATDPDRVAWATGEFRAAAAVGGGLRLEALRLRTVLSDGLGLTGSVTLAGQPLPFRLEVAPAEGGVSPGAPAADERTVVASSPAGSPPSALLAHLHFGPLTLDDFSPPSALTGGQVFHVTGQVEVNAEVRLEPGVPPRIAGDLRLDLARVEWPEGGLVIEGLRTTLGLASLQPPVSRTNDVITLRRVRWREREATNLTATLRCLPGLKFRLQLLGAHLFGGRVTSAPFLVDGRTGDLAVRLKLTDLDLSLLSREVPRWAGQLEGRVGGALAARRENGHWRPVASHLELSDTAPAQFEYPADGLLTGGLAPDSPRYQQLKLVEDGLKHLTLQALRVDLVPPEAPESVARIRLEGTSISPRAIVPVILNLNLNGSLEQLLEVLDRGTFEFSF